jgi:hypothetical protein
MSAPSSSTGSGAGRATCEVGEGVEAAFDQGDPFSPAPALDLLLEAKRILDAAELSAHTNRTGRRRRNLVYTAPSPRLC